jgi:plastocyanin
MTATILRRSIRLIAAVAVLAAAVAVQHTMVDAADYGVEIIEPSFDPQTWGYSADPVVVSVGDSITWVNTGIAPHSVTAYDGSFDSGIMPSGAVWSMTATTPGVFGYYCTLHPDMRATLIVEG